MRSARPPAVRAGPGPVKLLETSKTHKTRVPIGDKTFQNLAMEAVSTSDPFRIVCIPTFDLAPAVILTVLNALLLADVLPHPAPHLTRQPAQPSGPLGSQPPFIQPS